MTTAEKLKRIKERCEELLRSSNASELSNAAWRSTIAAIDALPDMGEHDAEILAANIIAAWPDELL